MNRNIIICILEEGFGKISLPNNYIINVQSCDDGCFITTNDMGKDILQINKYVGYPIYEIVLDNNSIYKDSKLGECRIIKRYKYEYIFWNTISAE